MSASDDQVRLQHMLEAAQKIAHYTQGKTRASLDEDELLQLALTRLLEIIGEAAVHISEPLQEAHPEIPWPAMRGIRNRLIHAYFDVNYDILWETVTTSIPALIEQLDMLLSEMDE